MSYSGNPSASDLDYVRFLIGDTDTTSEQLSDDEINALVTMYGSAINAASYAADSLYAKYARKVNKKIGDLSIDYSDLAKHYKDLATTLRRQASIRLAAPYAGGISKTTKEANEVDTDLVKPSFTKDMHTDRWNSEDDCAPI